MVTREQFDWLLDNLATPAAPLRWVEKIQAAAGPARWGLWVAQYLVLVIWASAFLWVWFTLFCVLFLYEGLGFAPWARSSSSPAETHH